MKEYEFHEAANIFPLDEEHLDELARDIRKNGQHVAIELMDGQSLDGRRRYRACKEAKIAPEFRKIEVADPVAYVLSLNLHRRHLTPSQAAMVGGRARDWYDAQAKERMLRGKKADPMVNLPQGPARDHAAKAVGVSGKSIDFASKVISKGTPALQAAVDKDLLAVSTAARAASLSH